MTMPTTVTTTRSGFCQKARRERSKRRPEAALSVNVVSFTEVIETQRGPTLRIHHAGQPSLTSSIQNDVPENYLLKKISLKVPVISFLNSSAEGLSMKTILGATFSASLIGGKIPGYMTNSPSAAASF